MPRPRGGPLVEFLILMTKLRLFFYGFAPIGTLEELDGFLIETAVSTGLIAYLLENLIQHLPGTYLALLGAPPLPFTLEFGSVVLPQRDVAAPRALRRLRVATFYPKP